jgi:hypothetical protein
VSARSAPAIAGIGTVAGLAVFAIGLALDPAAAWTSYLCAWVFGVSICIGALLLLMAGHAAKAGWMVVTRRIAESIVSALPLYAALFVPLLFGLKRVYAWDADPRRANGYQSAPYFVLRTCFYLAVFVTIGALLRRWSRTNDHDARPELVARMRRLSGAGLPVVGFALSWASFDWLMSIDPEWVSTVFGLYVFAGSFAGAIGLVAVALYLARARAGAASPVTDEHAHALGRLLFAMVVFWAYMAFSQLLIDWIGDIPKDIGYFADRTAGSWSWVTGLLVIGMFVGPFFALLGRRLKRRSGALAAIGAWVFAMHYVDVYWMVLPAHAGPRVWPPWAFFGASLFFASVSFSWIARDHRGAPPLPRHVPELAEGLDYEAAL